MKNKINELKRKHKQERIKLFLDFISAKKYIVATLEDRILIKFKPEYISDIEYDYSGYFNIIFKYKYIKEIADSSKPRQGITYIQYHKRFTFDKNNYATFDSLEEVNLYMECRE